MSGKGCIMEEQPHTAAGDEATTEPASTQDTSTILSKLPRSGTEDDIARLMEIYEAGERRYRASVQANAPTVRSSASTSL
jgi:hypothetical protein